MMNENSPICAMESPARIEVRVPSPARKAPLVTPTVLPTSTAAVRASTAGQCSRMALGSIDMPTATKKMAANMSRSGRMSGSTCRDTPPSATKEPARKAPSATENPAIWASRASEKQSPTLATSVVSSRRRRTTHRKARGTKYIPTSTTTVRKSVSRGTVPATRAAVEPLPPTTALRMARNRIATRSSMTSTP